MGDVFNPKKARTKHALPMWVDSFLRKTMTLSVEQIGAYNLILYAMWSRESCDLPADDAQIARVCRVTKTVWLRKFKPAMWPFFDVVDGVVISDRLQKEALFVEKYLKSQSDKKRGKNTPKPLKTNKPPISGDKSTDQSGENPTQQPNNPKEEDKSSSQEAADYQKYLGAHPKPVESKSGEAAFFKLICDGVDAKQIIASAAAYAETVKGWSSEAKVQQSDNFLNADRGKWKSHIPKPKAVQASEDDILRFWAETINEGRHITSSSISASRARAMVDAGYVTADQLSQIGIAV